MKKQIKILSVVMVIAIVICAFASCTKPETLSEVLTTVSQFESTDFEANIETTTETPAFVEGEDPMKTTIKLKLTGKTQGDKTYLELHILNEDKFNKLTDAYLIGSDIYINMHDLLIALSSASEDSKKMIEQQFKDEGHYVKMNIEEMINDGVPEEEQIEFDSKAYGELIHDISSISINAVQQASVASNPPLYSIEEKIHKITLTNENIEFIAHNLANTFPTILKTETDNLIAKYKEKGKEYACVVDELEKFKKDELENTVKAIEGLKDFKFDEALTINGLATFKLEDKKMDYVVDFKTEQDMNAMYDDDMIETGDVVSEETNEKDNNKTEETKETPPLLVTQTIKVSGFIQENKEVKIETPTNLLSEEKASELMSEDFLSSLLFGLMAGGQPQ